MAEISRRVALGSALLVAGAGAGALLGLNRTVHHRRAVPPPAPPAELTAALTRQRSLQADYDRLAAAGPSGPAYLAGLRSDVQAHGQALLALLELYPGWRLAQQSRPSPTGSPAGAAPVTVVALASASKSGAAALTNTCRRWPVGEVNATQVLPVLASIGAALSSHALVLAQP